MKIRLWEAGGRVGEMKYAVISGNMKTENVTNELVADEISRQTVQSMLQFLPATYSKMGEEIDKLIFFCFLQKSQDFLDQDKTKRSFSFIANDFTF